MGAKKSLEGSLVTLWAGKCSGRDLAVKRKGINFLPNE
jgi:hypothetical protein